MRSVLRPILIGAIVLFLLSGRIASSEEEPAFAPEKVDLIYEALIPGEESATVTGGDPVAKAGEGAGSADKFKRIAQMARKRGLHLHGPQGQWEFYYQDRQFFLLVDESGRVRLLTPVAGMDRLKADGFSEAKIYEAMLKANYLVTGELRFALNRQVIWLTYVHGVDTLAEEDFLEAIERAVEVAKKAFSK